MKVIGITGGIGAGKSLIVDYLQERYGVGALKADELAREFMQPCYAPYEKLTQVLPPGMFLESGQINRPALADLIFQHPEWKDKVNAIVHPAVKEWIQRVIDTEREKDELEYLIVEAALLIEENYHEICDELWYIYASEETRKERLRENRGYSEEIINRIFGNQLREEEFRKHCQVVIDNDVSQERALKQVDAQMAKE